MQGRQRKLSPWRVLLAVILLAIVSYGAYFFWQWWKDVQAATAHKPWFAAYVDVTATPTYAFEQLGTIAAHNAVLAFVVSSPTDACTPTWGGVYTLDEARDKLDLDRRIARLQQQGGNITVSFGGLRNSELAVKCIDSTKLLAAYQSVIDHYNLNTIDLDLENDNLTNLDAAKRRAVVIAELQSKRRSQGKSLAMWVTLPVSPQGLTQDGTNAVSQLLANGVDLAGVNIMTMDYGSSLASNQTMEQAAESALIETHRQLGILYKQSGKNLNNATLWSKIGATPMIGQNDTASEIFTLEEAKELNKFALAQGVGRMSMWSVNRDIECGENYVDTKVVSDACSGVKQDKLSFATTLGQNFNGDLKQNSSKITTNDADSNIQTPDDPAKSPYQIWKETGAYLTGAKVVWHHSVYQAKWWTQGDMPDNPILQAWQTPWQLIGPVLPGEKPITQPTLPKGTYPEWTGDTEYNAGDRVLFNSIPYQAKWWTKGDSPAAASANADSSPWVPLTQTEIEKITADVKTGKPVASSSATTKPSPTITPIQRVKQIYTTPASSSATATE